MRKNAEKLRRLIGEMNRPLQRFMDQFPKRWVI